MEGGKIQFSSQGFILMFGIPFLSLLALTTTEASSIDYVTGASEPCCNGEITGPAFGGNGGYVYHHHATFRKITVTYTTSSLYTITFTDKDNTTFKIGYNPATAARAFNIEYPNEYLTGISGEVGIENNYKVVKSIKFYTNLKEHGPFGSKPGTGTSSFSFTQTGGKVTGFHGRSGGLVDAIGVYLKPICITTNPKWETS